MPFLTHNALKITRRSLPLQRLPVAFEGFRIVQLSDLHFYEHTDETYYDRVVETVNELRPDAVFLTGDIVHYGDAYLDLAERYLKRLPTDAFRLSILGNHDYYDGARGEKVTAMLTRAGFEVLKNAHRAVEKYGARLWVAGLDDLWHGEPDPEKATDGIPPGEPVIMLGHNPLLFDPVAYCVGGRVDWLISGHTHAGHVYIPVLGPIYRRIFRMKYRYGMYEKNGCRLHVTSGVGSAAFYLKKQRIGFPRFRFNTHPEIAVLELTRNS